MAMSPITRWRIWPWRGSATGKLDDAWKTLANLAATLPAQPGARPHSAAAGRGRAGCPSRRASRRAVPPGRRIGATAATRRPRRRPRPIKPIEPALRVRAWAGLGKALVELGKPAGGRHGVRDGPRAGPRRPNRTGDRAGPGPRLRGQPAARRRAQGLFPDLGTFCEIGPGAASRPGPRPAVGKDGPPGGRGARIRAAARRRTLTAALWKPPGSSADALLAEWGWALLDAEKPAEADPVFARLLENTRSVRSPPTPASTWPSRPTPTQHTRSRPAAHTAPLAAAKQDRMTSASTRRKDPTRRLIARRAVSPGAHSGRDEGLGRCRGSARPLARGVSR